MKADVHWHEGLFLLPHHLQRMQRAWQNSLENERRLAWSHPYGVIEARLSREDLENHRIRFDKLRVTMPSGVRVSFDAQGGLSGGNTELEPLDIREAFAKSGGSLTVHLGVPLWQEGRANVVDPGRTAEGRSKLLYCIADRECRDENTGDNPQPIQTRLINARLVVDQRDTEGLELIPLMRVVRSAGEQLGLPRIDPEFAPPCLVLNGSAVLRELVRELIAQLETSRKELALQLGQSGFNIELIRGVQIAQLLRLQTLNRFSARLPALAQVPSLTPFVLYCELRGLLAELLALHPERDEFDVAAYDHDAPYPGFRELIDRIRSHLRLEGGRSYLSVPFEEVNGTLTAQLGDEHFASPNGYFLGVTSKHSPAELARFIEDGNKFKLMPISLVRAAVFGIPLKDEHYPPLELPAATDLHYFRLDCGARPERWEQARAEKALVLVWSGGARREIGGEWEKVDFRLFMTLPGGVKP